MSGHLTKLLAVLRVFSHACAVLGKLLWSLDIVHVSRYRADACDASPGALSVCELRYRDGGQEAKLDGDWPSRFALAVAFLLTVATYVSAAGAQVGTSPSLQTRERMVRAVDKTLQEGLHAKLPPHLSTLLGLSNEEECLVMQGVVRIGKMVQAFDVSKTNKDDVVLFVVNEATNNQTLYLTSKEGVLRKVVTVEEGVGRVQKITGEDRKAFEKEKQFWLDRLAPIGVP